MNNMKRIIAMLMISLLSVGQLFASMNDKTQTLVDETVSQSIEQEETSDLIAKNDVTSEDSTELNDEKTLVEEELTKSRRFSYWYLLPVIAAGTVLTGGLAIPVATGALSAEVAMGAALAAVVI